MLMTDIAIEHTKKSRKGGPDETFLMHPFENSKGADTGKYEILRDIVEAGQPRQKRSAHVTFAQLAELYARGLVETYKIRLRLRPAAGAYPTAPPGKTVPASCIQPGSEFDRLVRRVDTSTTVSSGLKMALKRMNMHL
jgi:hypothetical protein